MAAMNREAYADSNEGMRYSADEYAQILRDSGYEEDEIKQMVSDAYGSQDEEEDTNERNRRRSFLRTAGAIALAPARGVGRSIKNSFNRNFVHKMKEGDCIYVKKGIKKLIGKGIVESDMAIRTDTTDKEVDATRFFYHLLIMTALLFQKVLHLTRHSQKV